MSLTNEDRKKLLASASEIRRYAYAPYSNYAVGAALLTDSGKLYTGINIENAAYPTSMCAERVALFKAVSEGEKQFVAVAVVTANGGSPCGSCRQVLAEFGIDMQVLLADDQGVIHKEMPLSALLPEYFGPADLT